jgi:hypothetical protein
MDIEPNILRSIEVLEIRFYCIKTKKTKLHGLSPQANYTDRLSDHRLLAKFVPTLADRGCPVDGATIPPQSLILIF